MTHVCYSLQEAADKLKLTETVLVRLSQYFKMPRSAYEASGYLSFKGDLAFAEPDLQFFVRVKERLLMGDTLEMVKRHVDSLGAVGQSMASVVPGNAAGDSGAQATANAGVPAMPSKMLDAPMREIQDRQPYEKAAEVSFERYKSVHRTGLGRVFESMLKEVGATASEGATSSAQSGTQAQKDNAVKMAGTKPRTGRFSPFLPPEPERPPVDSSAPLVDKGSMGKASTHSAHTSLETASVESSWEQLLKQAVQQPRVLNSHLKSAAALLRERATTSQDAHTFRKNN